MLVYYGEMVRWIKMKLGLQVGLSTGHIVLDVDPAPLHQKAQALPQFSAHICCGQMAGWIKMPHGREVRLGPSDIVLDGDPAFSPQRGRIASFQPMSIVAKWLDGSRCHLVWR